METQFNIRALSAKDIAPMARIIGKIGLREFKEVVSVDAVKTMMGGAEDEESKIDLVGYGIVIDVAGILCANIDKAEKDIFAFLGDVSGMTAKQVGELSLADFAELAVTVVKADDFGAFFTRVKTLF